MNVLTFPSKQAKLELWKPPAKPLLHEPQFPMTSLSKKAILFVSLGALFILLSLDLIAHSRYSNVKTIFDRSFVISKRTSHQSVQPVAHVNAGGKWIVVTSVSSPTEDVKRLASFKDWNLVVVADTKTPLNWTLDGVHFLSVDYQKDLYFLTASSLPFKSYTRKNIGYLYAISQGAEWIYDTDDDNKPYDKLGLDQFEYKDTVSGVRFKMPKEDNSTDIQQRLFNPYRYFGMKGMWPRGFPLEHFEEHTNGNDTQVLCQKMRRAAVQQGLVHHDPDVDAIYRLQHAHPLTGLDVQFNKFTPPITLSVGTYSPWNSQNTLFHKSAFHTLFLPTTVSFRTTDIWRSFISQKVLHLSGLTVSFVPTNAVQYRNAHDYLKDFKDEKQVYEDSGKMIDYLHNWECQAESVKECVVQLAKDLVKVELWGQQDAELTVQFLDDLNGLGFQFPPLAVQKNDEYSPATNETTREVNCRRMNLEFELVDPKEKTPEGVRLAVQKLNYFGDISNWCNATGYSNLSTSFPSPDELADKHNSSYVLQNERSTVLVVANNFPWKYGMGLIQRLYQPYFATVIFCGSWYPDQITDADNFTSIISPFNYVHMNPAERNFSYHCLTLIKEMRLSNVKGYFFMSHETFFNIWQQIDYTRVHHLTGVTQNNQSNWQSADFGLKSAKRIVEKMRITTDSEEKATWKQFEDGLRKYGYLKSNETADKDMTSNQGRSLSKFFYIPSDQIEYYGSLMRIFYENQLFLEIAVNKFLRSVSHQTSKEGQKSYVPKSLRERYFDFYNKNMVAFHPVKVSAFRDISIERRKFCARIVQVFADIIIRSSGNYTMKGDQDLDYLNG